MIVLFEFGLVGSGVGFVEEIVDVVVVVVVVEVVVVVVEVVVVIGVVGIVDTGVNEESLGRTSILIS